jgi:hypothetical protein
MRRRGFALVASTMIATARRAGRCRSPFCATVDASLCWSFDDDADIVGAPGL